MFKISSMQYFLQRLHCHLLSVQGVVDRCTCTFIPCSVYYLTRRITMCMSNYSRLTYIERVNDLIDEIWLNTENSILAGIKQKVYSNNQICYCSCIPIRFMLLTPYRFKNMWVYALRTVDGEAVLTCYINHHVVRVVSTRLALLG